MGPLRGAPAAAALFLLVCACSPAELFPPPTPVSRTAPVMITSPGGGLLPTRAPAPAPPAPTATPNLIVLITTVVSVPTLIPGQLQPPTPTLVPADTRTPRPSPTRMLGSVTMPPPLSTRVPPPTTTPRPSSRVGDKNLQPTPVPTATPVDRNEPNNTPGQATGLGFMPIDGVISGPTDVDVYRVEVTRPGVTLVVTISGPGAARYKLEFVAPRSGKVGRQRLDGTVAMRGIVEVGLETGTYFVHVRATGEPPYPDPYFIHAEELDPPLG